jgi:antitoxin HigA-1
MKYPLDKIKGIHPGLIIDRLLKKDGISQRQFAISVGEHPQTLGAIINSKRRMNIELSLKIEEQLNLDEGYLMTLQVFYDIKQSKIDVNYKPDLSIMRKVTFWDTTIEKIDWKQMKIGVIKRVFSYGTIEEQNEILRFYGEKEVERVKKINHQI